MHLTAQDALRIAKRFDQDACFAAGTEDCLLVDVEIAKQVIEALGDSFDYEDPNNTDNEDLNNFTRILIKEAA